LGQGKRWAGGRTRVDAPAQSDSVLKFANLEPGPRSCRGKEERGGGEQKVRETEVKTGQQLDAVR
jgi:hypothetical protein